MEFQIDANFVQKKVALDWHYKNKDIANLASREYYKNNKENWKTYKNTSKEAKAEYDRAYRLSNKNKRNSYLRNKRKEDIVWRLRANLRTRLGNALRGHTKAGSAIKDLGCTVEELKTHLESQFKLGMSWENYGEWHIDHIKPLAKFDLTNRKELLEACHYTNLQPLWTEENLSKGSNL